MITTNDFFHDLRVGTIVAATHDGYHVGLYALGLRCDRDVAGSPGASWRRVVTMAGDPHTVHLLQPEQSSFRLAIAEGGQVGTDAWWRAMIGCGMELEIDAADPESGHMMRYFFRPDSLSASHVYGGTVGLVGAVAGVRGGMRIGLDRQSITVLDVLRPTVETETMARTEAPPMTPTEQTEPILALDSADPEERAIRRTLDAAQDLIARSGGVPAALLPTPPPKPILVPMAATVDMLAPSGLAEELEAAVASGEGRVAVEWTVIGYELKLRIMVDGEAAMIRRVPGQLPSPERLREVVRWALAKGEPS